MAETYYWAVDFLASEYGIRTAAARNELTWEDLPWLVSASHRRREKAVSDIDALLSIPRHVWTLNGISDSDSRGLERSAEETRSILFRYSQATSSGNTPHSGRREKPGAKSTDWVLNNLPGFKRPTNE